MVRPRQTGYVLEVLPLRQFCIAPDAGGVIGQGLIPWFSAPLRVIPLLHLLMPSGHTFLGRSTKLRRNR